VSPSDAFVFFGATGDLAYKKIFPALQRLVRSGRLSVPIIGVAKAGWDRERLLVRAQESLKAFGEFDGAAFDKLASLLSYVDGDYGQVGTFEQLRGKLGKAQHPLHYMAIPPVLFGEVVRSLERTGCAKGARLLVEKPFGHDLASAEALNRTILATFPETSIFRIDHFLGKEPVENLSYFRFSNGIFESIWNRHFVESVQVTLAEDFGIKGRGSFYDQTGAIRDVLQNHLLQVVATLAMEPPAHGEPLREARARTIRAVLPLHRDDVVRGQFRGYRTEPGVAVDSQVETYCAVRLFIDNSSWAGVPFFIRTGKCLPVTATEAHVVFKRPPRSAFGDIIPEGATYLRYRIGPDVTIALGMQVKQPGEATAGKSVELVAHSDSAADLTEYERLFGDALYGQNELFATQDGVEAEWRVVDDVLAHPPSLTTYEPGTWGPREAERLTSSFGGWRDPLASKSGGRSP
jgi:glucose-6-phosphate 1-dehydrogenase